jgi:hypothetical protein
VQRGQRSTLLSAVKQPPIDRRPRPVPFRCRSATLRRTRTGRTTAWVQLDGACTLRRGSRHPFVTTTGFPGEPRRRTQRAAPGCHPCVLPSDEVCRGARSTTPPYWKTSRLPVSANQGGGEVADAEAAAASGIRLDHSVDTHRPNGEQQGRAHRYAAPSVASSVGSSTTAAGMVRRRIGWAAPYVALRHSHSAGPY